MGISAKFYFKEQHLRDSQDMGKTKIPMHLTKAQVIQLIWTWGLIYENEAIQNTSGKKLLFFENYLQQGCSFILFSFVVNAATKLTEQIKINIREQINQVLIWSAYTYSVITLEVGESLDHQKQQRLPEENSAGHTVHVESPSRS